MRLSIKLYRVSCNDPKNVKEGIPCEALSSDGQNLLLDRSLRFKPGEMKVVKEAEIEALAFEGVFYKWLLSKNRGSFYKWLLIFFGLGQSQYIQGMDMALVWIRKGPKKGKIVLLSKEERTDLFSVTESLRYRGEGDFRYSGI